MIGRSFAVAFRQRISVDALDRPIAALAHYITPAERIADRWVHIVGLLAAIAGGAFLLALCLSEGMAAQTGAVGILRGGRSEKGKAKAAESGELATSEQIDLFGEAAA